MSFSETIIALIHISQRRHRIEGHHSIPLLSTITGITGIEDNEVFTAHRPAWTQQHL